MSYAGNGFNEGLNGYTFPWLNTEINHFKDYVNWKGQEIYTA